MLAVTLGCIPEKGEEQTKKLPKHAFSEADWVPVLGCLFLILTLACSILPFYHSTISLQMQKSLLSSNTCDAASRQSHRQCQCSALQQDGPSLHMLHFYVPRVHPAWAGRTVCAQELRAAGLPPESQNKLIAICSMVIAGLFYLASTTSSSWNA